MKKNQFRNLGLIAVLSSLAIGSQSHARPAYFTRYEMTGQQYQTEANERRANGYRLKYVDGYTRSGRARFAAIWEKVQGPGYIARHGLTRSEFNQQIREKIRGGEYQAILVDGYEDNGKDRYAIIWEKRRVPTQAIGFMMTSDKYQEEYNRLKNKGYSISYVSGYNINGKVYYAAIWDKVNSGDRRKFARHGMTYQAFRSEIGRQDRQMRLNHISAYTYNGTPYYAAIWEERKSGDPRQINYIGATNNQYDSDFFSKRQEGYLPSLITANDKNGKPRISVIFRTTRNPQTRGKSCTDNYCFSLNQLKQNIEAKVNPLNEKQLYKYAYEFSLGNAKISGAAGPYRGSGSRAFSVNDRLNPASVTKSSTAVGLIKAVTDTPGITLNSRIGPYLPSNWDSKTWFRNITFAQVLSHRTGLTQLNNGSCSGRGGIEYADVKRQAEEEEAGPIGNQLCGTRENPISGNNVYSNANYALARILIASLDGYRNWGDREVGKKVGERFKSYMNTNIFRPIGLSNVSYKPANNAPYFYPWPNRGWLSGPTDFGDYSAKPGSAGVQLSTHELNVFARAMFDGPLLTPSLRQAMKTNRMGLWSEESVYSGVKCHYHGGYFPQFASQEDRREDWGYEAQLSSIIIGCDNGLRGFMMVNGLNRQTGGNTAIQWTLLDALRASFSAP